MGIGLVLASLHFYLPEDSFQRLNTQRAHGRRDVIPRGSTLAPLARKFPGQTWRYLINLQVSSDCTSAGMALAIQVYPASVNNVTGRIPIGTQGLGVVAG